MRRKKVPEKKKPGRKKEPKKLKEMKRKARKIPIMRDSVFAGILSREIAVVDSKAGEITTKLVRLITEVTDLRKRSTVLKEILTIYKQAIDKKVEGGKNG